MQYLDTHIAVFADIYGSYKDVAAEMDDDLAIDHIIGQQAGKDENAVKQLVENGDIVLTQGGRGIPSAPHFPGYRLTPNGVGAIRALVAEERLS